MTNLVGRTQYQHAHADQAWPLELEGEKTFPFVASHGFGEHPTEFWLLPKSAFGKNEYGFLHVLPPTAMLFMRGDFVHAGGAMWHPRCHMKFYPKEEAGCVLMSQQNYWQLPNFKKDMTEGSPNDKIEQVFLWQHYKFPFAFPHSERTLVRKEAGPCVRRPNISSGVDKTFADSSQKTAWHKVQSGETLNVITFYVINVNA